MSDDAAAANVVRGRIRFQDDQEMVMRLCPELQQFYQDHSLDVSKLTTSSSLSSPWRFVRLSPRFDTTETLELLRKELTDHVNDKNKNHTTTMAATATRTEQEPLAVPWLDSCWTFYALPGSFSLASSTCYRSGRIYGMDISSGAGIAALLTNVYDQETTTTSTTTTSSDDKTEIRVLDLCTCPGLKLLAMADYFYQISASTTSNKSTKVKVVGVDINSSRMDKCKAIVQKYWVDSASPHQSRAGGTANNDVVVQLHLADGTTFGGPAYDTEESLVFDSRVAIEERGERGERKRLNKSARARHRKRLRQIANVEGMRPETNGGDDTVTNTNPSFIEKFDYVLVDAECSTDGSFKHIRERIKAEYDSSTTVHQEENRLLTDQAKLADLVTLQKKLIESGFRLLKPGGSMVYSTCSLSEEQNEKVVSWLLETNKDAFLIPIHFPSIMQSEFVTEGTLKGTVRFYPNLVDDATSEPTLLGDGFFASKLGKCIGASY
ncbi:tRNA/rRNA cytosine-C5-methylase [Nitzschia inconspicua]|uniref:tRNA/rRNA cytosine-C5-methylase n=1 Tax=Nitzschia inconspicua TaxID=303405 RepID=A0A9K3PQW8_9STRA|nr:tRNA/rRNA cytosine-C5-methylase [Nitzschia inconspicua]